MNVPKLFYTKSSFAMSTRQRNLVVPNFKTDAIYKYVVRILRMTQPLSEKKPRLNSVDKAIMHCLARNGRMRDIEMAEAISVSDDTVRRHRERLEKEGYLRIEAVFNPRKFGYTNIYQLGIVLAPGVDTREIAERLAMLEQVHYVALSLGPTHSIIANCRSKEQMELNKLVEELRRWREIERVDVNIIYEAVKTMFHRVPEDAFVVSGIK